MNGKGDELRKLVARLLDEEIRAAIERAMRREIAGRIAPLVNEAVEKLLRSCE